MQEQVGVFQFFQCRFEGGQKLRREIPDKSHGVGYYHFPFAREAQPAACSVERCEQFILDNDAAVCERVQKRGFSGVGVADYGDYRQPLSLAAAAPEPAAFGGTPEQLFEVNDSVARPTPIDFELGFAGPASAYAAGEARHRGVLRHEPGKQVFELCEFDLYFAVGALGVLGEDVQDQLGAVKHFQLGHVGDGPELRGIHILVEYQDVGGELHGTQDQVFHLAPAHQEARVELFAALYDGVHHAQAGGRRQLSQLFQ